MELYSIQKRSMFFTLKYPALIRIWHWLTFLLITGSMVTVLFVSTVFADKQGGPPNKGAVPGTSQQLQIESKSGEHRFDPSKLDPETRIAHTYENKIWDAHKIIGFGLCFLFLSRILIELTNKKEDCLVARMNKALTIPTKNTEEQQEKRHFLWVKRGYLAFYLFLLIMALTGLVMAFEHTPFLEPIQRPAREVHQIVQYLIYAYVLFHLVGVIRADLNKHKGIVSAMINGGNNNI